MDHEMKVVEYPRKRGLRLGFLIEIIVGIALGLTAVRWAERSMTEQSWRNSPGLFVGIRITTYTSPFIALLAMSGLAALIIERIRGRTPTVFGPGRWTWAIGGGVYLSSLILESAHAWLAISRIRLRSDVSVSHTFKFEDLFTQWFHTWLIAGPNGGLAPIIMAAWIAYTLAGYPRDPRPDER
jgi:hypothetical protein